MNNPSGMGQAEMLALMGTTALSLANRSGRRATHHDSNKPTVRTAERRRKRKAQRHARARNRR